MRLFYDIFAGLAAGHSVMRSQSHLVACGTCRHAHTQTHIHNTHTHICVYIQGGVKKSVTYAKVIWNKINLLVTHKCVVLLLRHLHSHQIRNKSTWWALLVLWSYNWRSHEPCHMPRCPLQPHSLQSKVGGIKFVLGRWVPQRLSCYKHFYCLVYQHTPFDPWQATLLESVIHIVCNYYYTLMGHEPCAPAAHIHPDICCEHLIGAIVMNAIVMCSRTREIADNVGLKRCH